MISAEEIRKLAKLSRLKIEASEVSTLVTTISNIVEHFSLLKEVNTDGIEPMSHVQGVTNVFRADEVEPPFTEEQTFMNAPDRFDTFFKVPLVPGQEE